MPDAAGFVPAAFNEKLILIAMMASGLVACAQSTAPQEDSRLKEAYSACINTAQGSPEKLKPARAC